MNSSYVTACKDNKIRRKTLSIQIYDDDICKIEGKSLIEQTYSHKRTLSKDSNNLALNSGSLILSETVSNASVHTFRISKSSLTISTVRKGGHFSLNSSQEKNLDMKRSNCELSLQSILMEDESEGNNKNLYKNTLISRSSSSESINKSYVSNFSVIAVNKDKQAGIANKSLICTPNTICNYYLHSNDITPNKLCYNAASNLSNATDALNSVSATSSNQDLKAKISKINFINNNVYQFNSSNSCAFEENVNDNFENNSNFNHGGRNYFDKRTPIKYNKSQFRSGEKDTLNSIKEDSSKRSSSNKDHSSSLTDMLKINSKLINERLSLIAKEFKKNLNISELEIERDEEKSHDLKNLSYSNMIELESNRKDKEMANDEKFKIFSDAKNLNFEFEQIKDLEGTYADCSDHRKVVNSNYNKDNLENQEITINLLKNENFSFDITYNRAAINVINEQIDSQKAIQKDVEVINEKENEYELDIKSEFTTDRKINAYNEQDSNSININNSIKRIENYSFGSVNNTNLNNLTALCSNLQQNRTNLINKLSNNLRKFNLHPDLRSLFRKNKSHKQFENTMMEKNGEKLEEIGDDCKKENLDFYIETETKEAVNYKQEKIQISGDKLYPTKDKDTPINVDKDIIWHKSSKNTTKNKLSPNYSTNEKQTEATMPSTGKSNQLIKQNQSSKTDSFSKELSEFEIKNSALLTKSKKEEIPNKIGLNIKEIVIRAKDKGNKTTSTSYFSPGERKKNSISPRYNLKKAPSKPILSNETLICPGRNLKFLDMIKLYSTKGQSQFINKGTSPANSKFNSYTKSYSKSRLNGTSFVSNNNSYARSSSRNNSKTRTIEATYQADQMSGNQSYIKIQNSVKKNDTKDFRFTEAMDAEESIPKKIIDSECKSVNNKSNISQYKKHVIPVHNKEKTVGIIKSMKDMSKHSELNYKCSRERIIKNLNTNAKTNSITNNEIKTNPYSNSKANNKIKLNHQINNVQIASISSYGKENKKDLSNIPEDPTRNNAIDNGIIQNTKASASNITNGGLNKKENFYIAKGVHGDSSIKGEENNTCKQPFSVNNLNQNKKSIQVISNFSSYTKKKTPDVTKQIIAKQSNEINTALINKQNAVSNFNKINHMNDKKASAQSSRINLDNNRSRLMKEKINEIINKQIVSSKIQYLSGDDDFVFFDE